eukprot:5075802-Prymnesium_polylepis.1
MNFLVNHRIQSIKSLRKNHLVLGDRGQWERFADGAEACQSTRSMNHNIAEGKHPWQHIVWSGHLRRDEARA